MCDRMVAAVKVHSPPVNVVPVSNYPWLEDLLPDDVGIVIVADEDDFVYDILLNGESVGYFALGQLTGQSHELLAQGPTVDIQALCEEHDYAVYTLSLFGGLEGAMQ